jgi:hypothetical protein
MKSKWILKLWKQTRHNKNPSQQITNRQILYEISKNLSCLRMHSAELAFSQ